MQSETLIVQPKLRVYFVNLILVALIGVGLLMFLSKIPPNGLYVLNIFDIKNQWIRNKIIKVLRYHISYVAFQELIAGCFLMLMAYVVCLWLKVKTTTITFTNKYLEYKHGILNQKNDCIDMIDIKDQEMYRSLLSRIIGISKVTVLSKDLTTPKLDIVLAKIEADDVLEFLKVHSTRNIVDYQLTRDMRGKGGGISVRSPKQIMDNKPDDNED